jgi:hypothetical protein
MRAWPGKTGCILLDFAGNTARHGPIARQMPYSLADRPGKPRGRRPKPDDTFPRIATFLAKAGLRFCGMMLRSGLRAR